MTKATILEHCIQVLQQKINMLENEQADRLEDAAAQGKSTAGDKHDTALAMAHIEQAQQAQVLQEWRRQVAMLSQPDWQVHKNEITSGCYVVTNKNHYFIGVALGKIEIENTTILSLSPASPMGQRLKGHKMGDSITWGADSFKIISIE
jgi:transcription elongation GreA/GreB family factor